MAEFLKRSMTSQSQKQPSPLPPNGKFSFRVTTYQRKSKALEENWLVLIYSTTILDRGSGQGRDSARKGGGGGGGEGSEKRGREREFEWGCLNISSQLNIQPFLSYQ